MKQKRAAALSLLLSIVLISACAKEVHIQKDVTKDN